MSFPGEGSFEPVGFSFAPSGLGYHVGSYPGLAPWAAFFRRSAAALGSGRGSIHATKVEGSLLATLGKSLRLLLQRGFDFEAPGFEERFGDVL